MSHIGWTGMLAPEPLAALETANGTKPKRTDALSDMSNSSLLPHVTYTESDTSASVRFGERTTVHSTTARHAATAFRPDPSPQRFLRTWLYAPSVRVRPPQFYSHTQPAGLMPTTLPSIYMYRDRVVIPDPKA